jgi:MFS family permease
LEKDLAVSKMVSLIWRVNIATMLFFTIVQVVVPLIPQYAKKISADPVLIGFAVASISITAILLRPASGVVSDRWSRSKLMVLGLILASIAYFILYSSNDILHIVIARLVEGAGVASFVPSSIASAVDQAPEGKLGQTLGWRSMMIGIGFTIGPGIGGILAEILDYKTTFGISSLLLVIAIPFAFYRESGKHSPRATHSIRGIRERGFIVALFALILYGLSWMGVYTFLSASLTNLPYAPLVIGLYVIIQGLSSVALRALAGKMADKRPAMMAYLGLLLMSLGLFVIYLTQVPPNLYIAAPIFGIGLGIYVPGSQTLALMRCPPDNRGYLSGIYTMGLDVGTLIGPILFGVIIQFTNSYQDVFALAPVLMFIAAIVILVPTRGYNQ